MEEWASSADRHTRRVLFVVIGKTEKSVDNLVINNGLTISMKYVNQHSTQRKIVFADMVVVFTIELTKRWLLIIFLCQSNFKKKIAS